MCAQPVFAGFKVSAQAAAWISSVNGSSTVPDPKVPVQTHQTVTAAALNCNCGPWKPPGEMVRTAVLFQEN